jgi:Family of unknown function (DUF5681)
MVKSGNLYLQPFGRSAPDGNPNIVELGKPTRWKPGQSGNPGGRPKRTPFADACREVGELTDFEEKPGDPGHLRLAKALMRLALRGGIGSVQAALALMDRAEGRPAQAVVQQSDSPSDALTATIRIALARCEAYNMPVPEFLRDAEKLILGPAEAMTTSGEPEPPGDNESAHKATENGGGEA